ncbi:MAG: transporter ATP-binding protein LivF [Pseudomonadota bacterium]|jgi:branched-chain amino acid transport system ATP-binding protein
MSASTQALLRVRGLRAFHGPQPVLHGMDLDVRAGEIVAVLGRNGAGRSTLLQALMGQVRAQGSVMWQGAELLGWPPHEIARAGLAWVPESRDVFAQLTVQQNLVLGEQPRSKRASRAWTVAEVYAQFPLLRARAHTLAGVLSGGEQQLLSLCRALMGGPALLLVDEPTEGLSPAMAQQVMALIATLPAQGMAVLLVAQHLSVALPLASRCLLLGRGRVVFSGTPAELRAQPALQQEWLAV